MVWSILDAVVVYSKHFHIRFYILVFIDLCSIAVPTSHVHELCHCIFMPCISSRIVVIFRPFYNHSTPTDPPNSGKSTTQHSVHRVVTSKPYEKGIPAKFVRARMVVNCKTDKDVRAQLTQAQVKASSFWSRSGHWSPIEWTCGAVGSCRGEQPRHRKNNLAGSLRLEPQLQSRNCGWEAHVAVHSDQHSCEIEESSHLTSIGKTLFDNDWRIDQTWRPYG